MNQWFFGEIHMHAQLANISQIENCKCPQSYKNLSALKSYERYWTSNQVLQIFWRLQLSKILKDLKQSHSVQYGRNWQTRVYSRRKIYLDSVGSNILTGLHACKFKLWESFLCSTVATPPSLPSLPCASPNAWWEEGNVTGCVVFIIHIMVVIHSLTIIESNIQRREYHFVNSVEES